MARSANCPVQRHHLVALAGEALTMAEEYVEVAPPELLSNVSEFAKRLRLEMRQLKLKITSCRTGQVL